jgi:hypothetical protein
MDMSNLLEEIALKGERERKLFQRGEKVRNLLSFAI